MVEYISISDATNRLQDIVGQTLQYGIKSKGCGLYDFGLGKYINIPNFKGGFRTVCQHTLHIDCRFKVISQKGKPCVDKFFEDSSCKEFHAKIKHLIGLEIKRIALSNKHDLWLDLEDYWIVFATNDDGEESWRYFTPGSDKPHLVASDLWICLDY